LEEDEARKGRKENGGSRDGEQGVPGLGWHRLYQSGRISKGRGRERMRGGREGLDEVGALIRLDIGICRWREGRREGGRMDEM